MFTRVLVPLDGSARAERAVPVAARLARAADGAVILVRVVPINREIGPYFVVPPTAVPSLGAEPLKEASAYLEHVARSTPLDGVRVETSVSVGEAAPALLDALTQQQADLVVLCSHGRGGFLRWALGSVAQHLVRHATVPTLVLREETAWPAEKKSLRMLVPLDGSPLAETVLTPAVTLLTTLAASEPAALHLVCMVDPVQAALAGLLERIVVSGAESYLARVAQQVRDAYPTAHLVVTSSVLLESDAAAAILRVAGRELETPAGTEPAYDLLALATHGRSGFARWALGSVAERLMHTARLPVLLQRPPAMVSQTSTPPAAQPGATLPAHAPA